jgi:hypothetical protein
MSLFVLTLGSSLSYLSSGIRKCPIEARNDIIGAIIKVILIESGRYAGDRECQGPESKNSGEQVKIGLPVELPRRWNCQLC